MHLQSVPSLRILEVSVALLTCGNSCHLLSVSQKVNKPNRRSWNANSPSYFGV